MKGSIKKHLKENYIMYLIFITMFLIVLVAFQNRSSPKNDGLSQRERDQVKQLIKNAELPKNNRNIMFWLAVFVILFMILLYNFVIKKEMETHLKIIGTVKQITKQGKGQKGNGRQDTNRQQGQRQQQTSLVTMQASSVKGKTASGRQHSMKDTKGQGQGQGQLQINNDDIFKSSPNRPVVIKNPLTGDGSSSIPLIKNPLSDDEKKDIQKIYNSFNPHKRIRKKVGV